MPIYPTIKTYRGGFYNNTVKNGMNTRVYSAMDMRKPYDVVFTDGIKPDPDGTVGNNLKVTAIGDRKISIATGFAKLGGAWFENESAYIIKLDEADASDRYDCVIVRNDDSEAVKEPSIYIKSLRAVPTIANIDRVGDVYEVCIAYVRVPALATDFTQANITDTRDDGSLCNVMSGVGAIVVRTYHKTYFSNIAGQTDIPIGIPEYNKNRDHLTVFVNGRVFVEGTNYTIKNNETITLNLGLPVVGTRVDFEVRKNVNAAGADTVVQEVAILRADMTAAQEHLEHHYYCNGKTDNTRLASIISAFQNGATDNGSMRIVIHGNFGATSPHGGAGTTENPYYWVRAAQGSASSRRVVLDFTDCRQISINCEAGTSNIIFFGMDVYMIGANVVATGGATITMFSTAAATTVYAENCRFWITCESGGFIARSGTFKNCRASVTNAGLHSYCFVPISGSLVRVEGGEYYAYTASSAHYSAIVGATSGENGVAILLAVNAPTSARSGYFQTHSVYQTTGYVNTSELISTLPIVEVSGRANHRGTIKVSKAGLM